MAKIQARKLFTWKHLLALGFAVTISVGILLFQEQIESLGRLGYLGVFLITLLGNATTLLPAPSMAFVFLLSGALPNPLLVALAAAAGAALGESTGYLAGLAGSDLVTRTKLYGRIHKKVEKYGALAIFFIASIPNPFFDLAGISAGALKMPWLSFVLATFAGKLIVNLVVALTGARWL